MIAYGKHGFVTAKMIVKEAKMKRLKYAHTDQNVIKPNFDVKDQVH